MKVYFSDFFNVSSKEMDSYGAFNISLINDLPLFIDPFLLFGSKKKEYQNLHNDIIDYLFFLKNKSAEGIDNISQIKSWYLFSEVKQNWFGYSKYGNSGSGLGQMFGKAMSSSMHIIFDDLRNETITQSSHLEKAALFEIGVGRDNISDFATNLIKEYLLNYTEIFSKKHIDKSLLREINVDKVFFDYELERWMPKIFTLPYMFGDFVILTPKDILTKDETWINRNDLQGDFTSICNSIPDDQLRSEILNYLQKKLPNHENNRRITKRENSLAIQETITTFPEIIKWYIKIKEENKEGARNISKQRVEEVAETFVSNVKLLIGMLQNESEFYQTESNGSYNASIKRIEYLKHVIENNDGYKLFYSNDDTPIRKESDLQLIFKLTWFASDFDVNREVNNGRGAVDYSVSQGSKDKTLIEFKLASNSKLKQNLANQVGVYEAANKTKDSIKVILYFNDSELKRIKDILTELKLETNPNIILIDAGPKISASNVK